MIKIAIDPGKNGAIAYYIKDKVFSHKCPDTETEMVDLLADIKEIAEYNNLPVIALLEKVGAMPHDGKSSIWKFATNVATWRTALIAIQIPFKEIPPTIWQKNISTNMPKEKHDRKVYIKSYAQKRYPNEKVTLVNADALGMLSVIDKLW